MSLQDNDLKTLQGFVQGAMARAELHAKQVRAITLANPAASSGARAGTIKIEYHDGDLANALSWVSVSVRGYACTYNHDTGEVEVRDGGARGPVLHAFTNATPITDVESFFQSS
jgi:hypothetical protein